MAKQSASNTPIQPRANTPTAARIGFDGVLVGTLGAVTMALWFLIVDLIDGEPLYTPTVLANWLLGVKEGSQAPAIPLNAFDVISSYTWVHWLVFVALGGIVSWLISATERNPDLGFGVVLLVTILVVAVTGFIAVFATQVLHVLTWPTILVGNLLAAAVMATYFWRRHRHLRINRDLSRERESSEQFA